MKKTCLKLLCLGLLGILFLNTLQAQKKYHYIRAQNGQYMTVLNNNQQSGTPVVIANFIGDNSQKWELAANFKNGENDCFFLRTPGGKVLDIPWNKSDNGTSLQIWDLNGAPNQRWQFEIISGNLNSDLNCYIQSTTGMRTVDFCSNGRPIYIWSYNASNCQKWTIVPCR